MQGMRRDRRRGEAPAEGRHRAKGIALPMPLYVESQREVKRSGPLPRRTPMKRENAERRQRRRQKYQKALKSKASKDAREKAVERAGYKCELCGGVEDLQCHHVHYQRLGHELPSDYAVLCGRCHRVEEANKRPWNRGKY